MTTRERVLAAFQPPEAYAFSHVEPYEVQDFIDGMAWLGVLAGAAKRAGDEEVSFACERWLGNVTSFGPSIRNFAPVCVNDKWRWNETYKLFTRPAPLGFAGPCGLWYAKEAGVVVPNGPSRPTTAAIFLRLFAFSPWWPDQHTNSIMLAHLLDGKRPPRYHAGLAKDNPLYSAIFGMRCSATYPDNAGIWPAKQTTYKDKGQTYVPICQLAADYLQEILRGEL